MKSFVSSSQDTTGYLPPGEIPEESKASASGYLPSGETPVSQEAESTGDLSPGKISVEEAKKGDVEMNAAKDEEEVPQDKQTHDVEEVDYPESEVGDEAMLRANELVSSELNDDPAREEHRDAPLEPRPRIANPAHARFLSKFCEYELDRIDAELQRDRERTSATT